MSSRDHIDRMNYYSDSRVRAGERSRHSPIKGVNTNTMKATVVIEEEDEESGDMVEVEHELPVTFEVCPTCEGRGKHVNPSVDAGGLSAEDFYEDPDFAESYMEGHYDVTCYECGGNRVVPVINRDRCDPEILKKLDDREEADAQYRREVEAERRFGC
jgi:hypothetical protein